MKGSVPYQKGSRNYSGTHMQQSSNPLPLRLIMYNLPFVTTFENTEFKNDSFSRRVCQHSYFCCTAIAVGQECEEAESLTDLAESAKAPREEAVIY